MWILKNDINELFFFYKTETDSQTLNRNQTYGYQRGKMVVVGG